MKASWSGVIINVSEKSSWLLGPKEAFLSVLDWWPTVGFSYRSGFCDLPEWYPESCSLGARLDSGLDLVSWISLGPFLALAGSSIAL